jgi:hypothetical protein
MKRQILILKSSKLWIQEPFKIVSIDSRVITNTEAERLCGSFNKTTKENRPKKTILHCYCFLIGICFVGFLSSLIMLLVSQATTVVPLVMGLSALMIAILATVSYQYSTILGLYHALDQHSVHLETQFCSRGWIIKIYHPTMTTNIFSISYTVDIYADTES